MTLFNIFILHQLCTRQQSGVVCKTTYCKSNIFIVQCTKFECSQTRLNH